MPWVIFLRIDQSGLTTSLELHGDEASDRPWGNSIVWFSYHIYAFWKQWNLPLSERRFTSGVLESRWKIRFRRWLQWVLSSNAKLTPYVDSFCCACRLLLKKWHWSLINCTFIYEPSLHDIMINRYYTNCPSSCKRVSSRESTWSNGWAPTRISTSLLASWIQVEKSYTLKESLFLKKVRGEWNQSTLSDSCNRPSSDRQMLL